MPVGKGTMVQSFPVVHFAVYTSHKNYDQSWVGSITAYHQTSDQEPVKPTVH